MPDLTGLLAGNNIWIMIALAVYLILPANSPIKAFINKILAGILKPGPTPGPTPEPGPGPAPNPTFDLNTILQLLMNLLLKAKASGDTKQQEAILSTIEAVQAEQLSMQKSAIPNYLR